MTADTISRTWVHIGLPKTGTKTLQAFLFGEHPELWYMGALQQDARRRGRGKAGKWRDAECGEIARCVMGRVPNSQLVECGEISRKVLDRAREQGRQFLMSAEGLSLNGAPTRLDRARKLQQVFGDCQILIVLRNPFGLVRCRIMLS